MLTIEGMDEIAFLTYANGHIAGGSDLPRVTPEKLGRWARLGLLIPPYSPQHLEQVLKLLLLERAVVGDTSGNRREVIGGAAP